MSKLIDKLIKNTNKLYLILVLCVLTFGIFLRLEQYFSNSSLWLDESMLALNIVRRSYVELFTPLDYNQGAPILFLIIEKLFISIFGNNEFSLRAFPLLSGISVLFLTYYVGRLYFSNIIAISSMFMVTISPQLIRYSSEVKQYSSDVMATLIILILTAKCMHSKTTKIDFLVLALTGSILIFLSHAVLFSIMSCCIVLLLFWFPKNLIHLKKYTFITIVFWFSLYLIFYFISLNSLTKNDTLTDYWQNYFFPFPPWRNLDWLKNNFLNNLHNLLEFNYSPIIFFLFLMIGVLFITLSKERINLLIFLLPIPGCLIFSIFHIYPFGDRMILFTIPIIYFLLNFGICSLSNLLFPISKSKFSYIFYIIFLVYFSLGSIKTIFESLRSPSYREHIRPLISDLIHSQDTFDSIYVYYATKPAINYYMEYFQFDFSNIYWGSKFRQNPEKYILEIEKMDLNGDVWFIFTHNCSWCVVNERDFIVEYLDSIGTMKKSINYPGTNGYLYSLK